MNIKKSKFGIISGAGPMAGCLLYRRIIEKLQNSGAWHDTDFPEIVLINFPFSNMLSTRVEYEQIRQELLKSLEFVSPSVDYVYIACQTLHIFLEPEEFIQYKIINLLDLIKQSITDDDIAVVASTTSRAWNLHPKYLGTNCYYIEPNLSDEAINNILKGKKTTLEWLENLAQNKTIILGCTEFSVELQHKNIKNIIDPIELAANNIVNIFSDSSHNNALFQTKNENNKSILEITR